MLSLYKSFFRHNRQIADKRSHGGNTKGQPLSEVNNNNNNNNASSKDIDDDQQVPLKRKRGRPPKASRKLPQSSGSDSRESSSTPSSRESSKAPKDPTRSNSSRESSKASKDSTPEPKTGETFKRPSVPPPPPPRPASPVRTRSMKSEEPTPPQPPAKRKRGRPIKTEVAVTSPDNDLSLPVAPTPSSTSSSTASSTTTSSSGLSLLVRSHVRSNGRPSKPKKDNDYILPYSNKVRSFPATILKSFSPYLDWAELERRCPGRDPTMTDEDLANWQPTPTIQWAAQPIFTDIMEEILEQEKIRLTGELNIHRDIVARLQQEQLRLSCPGMFID